MRLLVHGALLWDGTGRDPIPKAGLVAEGGVITLVGPDPTLPRPDGETTVVDAGGATLMPGLINCHTHITRRHLHRAVEGAPIRFGAGQIESLPDPQRLAWALRNAWDELLEGTTTFRDCGSKNGLSLELKRVLQGGTFRGPRVLACGQALAMTGGHGTGPDGTARPVDGPGAVRQAVRQEMARGADWIKLMASGGLIGMPEREHPRWVEYTPEELRAGVEEAHKRGRRVCAHCGSAEAVKNCLRAGVDTIEHGMLMDEEAVQMMREAGAFLVPTLTGLRNVALRERRAGNTAFADYLEREVLTPHRDGVRMAHQAGVPIATGTDTLGQMVEEVKALIGCGLSPSQALMSATSVAARALGLAERVGTLEPGREADLLLLEGNPLEEPDALRRVKAVFRRGHKVTPAWLLGPGPR